MQEIPTYQVAESLCFYECYEVNIFFFSFLTNTKGETMLIYVPWSCFFNPGFTKVIFFVLNERYILGDP